MRVPVGGFLLHYPCNKNIIISNMANINIGNVPKKRVQNVSITDMAQPKAKPINVSAIKPAPKASNIIDMARPVKKGSHLYASTKPEHYGVMYRRLGPISVIAGPATDASRKQADARKVYIKKIKASNAQKLRNQ